MVKQTPKCSECLHDEICRAWRHGDLATHEDKDCKYFDSSKPAPPAIDGQNVENNFKDGYSYASRGFSDAYKAFLFWKSKQPPAQTDGGN